MKSASSKSTTAELAYRAQQRAKRIQQSLQNFDLMPGSALIRMPMVTQLLGVSAATVYRMVKTGLLEPPERIGARSSGYKVSSIRKVLGSK